MPALLSAPHPRPFSAPRPLQHSSYPNPHSTLTPPHIIHCPPIAQHPSPTPLSASLRPLSLPTAPTRPRGGCGLLGVPRGAGCCALLLSLPLPLPGPGGCARVPGRGDTPIGGCRARACPGVTPKLGPGRCAGAWHGGVPRGRARGLLGRADRVTSPGQDLAQPVAGDS